MHLSSQLKHLILTLLWAKNIIYIKDLCSFRISNLWKNATPNTLKGEKVSFWRKILWATILKSWFVLKQFLSFEVLERIKFFTWRKNGVSLELFFFFNLHTSKYFMSLSALQHIRSYHFFCLLRTVSSKKCYSPFLWMGFKATATSRRHFTFYH